MAINEAPQNMMIGGSPHIREVGPHPHAWQRVGADSAQIIYEQCELCGTRRTVGFPTGRLLAQADWLAGGEWQGEGYELQPTPPVPVLGLAALVDPLREESPVGELSATSQVIPEPEPEPETDNLSDLTAPPPTARPRGRPRKQ